MQAMRVDFCDLLSNSLYIRKKYISLADQKRLIIEF